MKRLLFIIVISIFLYPQLFFSKIVFADNLIGPKIYDLQIGMAVSDAKQIIEGICKQYNVNCTEFSASAYEPGLFIYNDKNIKGFGSAGYNIEIFYRDNSIIGYTLPFKIFNFENSMNRDTFFTTVI